MLLFFILIVFVLFSHLSGMLAGGLLEGLLGAECDDDDDDDLEMICFGNVDPEDVALTYKIQICWNSM